MTTLLPVKVLHEATLRCAEPAEIDAIEAFIEEVKRKDAEGGKHLLARPPAEYRHAAENRLLYVCVIKGDIVALSGVFFVPFSEAEQARPEYLEFGSTAVHPDWRGYRLQKLLGRVRVAMAAIAEPKLVLGTAIDPTNLGSRKSMTNIGFEVWQPADVPVCAFEPCTGCVKLAGLPFGSKCCCEFLRLPETEKVAQISALLGDVLGGLPGAPIEEMFAPARLTVAHKNDEDSSLSISLDCFHLRSVLLLRDLATLSGKALPF